MDPVGPFVCVLLGLPDLPDDPRFASNEARVERQEELKAILETRLKTRSKRDWTERLSLPSYPLAPSTPLAQCARW